MTKMARIIKSFSLSREENAFLEENRISPTAIIRARIQEMMNLLTIDPKIVKEKQRQIEVWQEISNKQKDFIQEKGLLDEYLKKEGFTE